MDVCVIGAGAMGLSAGRVLAGRGHRVEVIDAHGVSNGLASSAGATRLWRLAHQEDAMVRLAQDAVAGWRALEAAAATELLLTRGVLVRGHGADLAAAAVQRGGKEMDVVDGRWLAAEFPEFRHDVRRPVFWQPEAGVVLAAKALAVQADQLILHGGTLTEGERVLSVDERAGSVRIRTDERVRTVDVVVMAAGPWSSSFLAALGVDVALDPVVEQVCYFGSGDGGWVNRPCVYDWGDEIDPLRKYCMPTPGIGYKVGIDHQLRGFTASDTDRTASPERTASTEAVVARDFPGFDARSVRADVCCYTNSPDDHFILDRVGSVVLGCGDSGQAFKFSPLIGEYLADLAEGRPHPAGELFGLARFGESVH